MSNKDFQLFEREALENVFSRYDNQLFLKFALVLKIHLSTDVNIGEIWGDRYKKTKNKLITISNLNQTKRSNFLKYIHTFLSLFMLLFECKIFIFIGTFSEWRRLYSIPE